MKNFVNLKISWIYSVQTIRAKTHRNIGRLKNMMQPEFHNGKAFAKTTTCRWIFVSSLYLKNHSGSLLGLRYSNTHGMSRKASGEREHFSWLFQILIYPQKHFQQFLYAVTWVWLYQHDLAFDVIKTIVKSIKHSYTVWRHNVVVYNNITSQGRRQGRQGGGGNLPRAPNLKGPRILNQT